MAVPETVRQLLEGSVDAAVVLDRDRRILYFNPAYEAMSGVRGRVLAERVRAGVHCFEVFPLEICKESCAGCRAREAGRPLRLDEIGAVRGDSEELTCIVTAVPLKGGMVAECYRDVTAEVRVQRRLKVLLEHERRAKVDLEAIVAERTRELRQVQARLVLQEKMSSLGRLVAGIAHELNNPINFVYGNVDFLAQYLDDLVRVVDTLDRRSDLSPEVRSELERVKREVEFDFLLEDSRKLLKSIRVGAERTAGIVRDLKAFARTDSVERQETDVVAGIEATLNLIAPLWKGRIEIERDFDADVPPLWGNAGHIHQVFMNILTNAAQAIGGPGTIRIRVARGADPARGPVVTIAVSDTGQGIAPDVIEHITDPFFTTKEVGEGTGLGLWITDSIIRAHGGTLTCESELGRGATFTVTLPQGGSPEASRDQRGGQH